MQMCTPEGLFGGFPFLLAHVGQHFRHFSVGRGDPSTLERLHFFHIALEPSHATDLAAASLLHGSPEFVTLLLPLGERKLMHRRTGVSPALLDRDARVRKPVHLKDGRIDDLPHEIIHPLIVARRDAQQLG
jgi:hypothetical protein